MPNHYTPCGDAIYWPPSSCPSGDARCMGCPRRPEPPSAELAIGVGGMLELSRSMVRALGRVLRSYKPEDELPLRDVDRILERWIELRHFGGARGADVATRAHMEPGWLLWISTVDAKVWSDSSECVPLHDAQGRIAEWMPAVYLVASLRWYEEPALREGGQSKALNEALAERRALERTPQYQQAMRRLAREFGACDDGFLRVALGAR